MGKMTFILGGARSGKSRYAESLASEEGGKVLFIATAQALDEEMELRIQEHQTNRPESWTTLELPLDVGGYMMSHPIEADVIIVDCLTMLMSNILMGETDSNELLDELAAVSLVDEEINNLLVAIDDSNRHWIIVSNEVGMGLVPTFPLGRIYRDLLGRVNQRVARNAEKVILMVAGIPMVINQP